MDERNGIEGRLDRELVRALTAARAFVGYWRDPATRALREDIAQGAVVEAWMRRDTLRDAGRFQGFVRTVARRMRHRALRGGAEPGATPARPLSLDAVRCEPPRWTPAVAGYPVAGRELDPQEVAGWLWGALATRRDVGSMLLQRHCEGFSCDELADRYGLSESMVRSRMHRTRHRLRSLALHAILEDGIAAEGRLRARSVPGPETRSGERRR